MGPTRAVLVVLAALVAAGAGYLAADALTGPVPIVLGATALGPVPLGTSEAAATTKLVELLGKSDGPAQSYDEGGCGSYDLLTWSTELQVFFMSGRLVGYITAMARNLDHPVTAGNARFETAKGLRIGDTVTVARHLYGAAFTVSSAQGGSWSIAVPSGRLIGYLTNPPIAGPSTEIAGIAAGYVGCPAMTP